jgi:DNA-binding CsgD family transcriptional regulator
MTLSENQVETIRENTENLAISDQELKDLQDESWITEKQFVVYVLSESGMTQKEIADVMDYSDPGTVSGYKSRVQTKINKSERTIEVEDVFNSNESVDVPDYLKTNEEIRDTEMSFTVSELHSLLYQLDWIDILKQAVESRPNSWGVKQGKEHLAVSEWRNSSDQLIAPVWKNLFNQLKRKGIIDVDQG